MDISIFDLFNIGIGPSSSHTIGPMRAAKHFVEDLENNQVLQKTVKLKIHIYGSLAFTGEGHGTHGAIFMGLMGFNPETISPKTIQSELQYIGIQNKLKILNKYEIDFHQEQDLIIELKETLQYHTNAMQFIAFDQNDNEVFKDIYYSVGGGFIVAEKDAKDPSNLENTKTVKYHFDCCDELTKHCRDNDLSIAEVMATNETTWRDAKAIDNQLKQIWQTMSDSIDNGIATEGVLPGVLKVRRRAKALYEKIKGSQLKEHGNDMMWLNLFAIAVNEENAAGNRVVTAPTNGASGIIPAVFKFYQVFYEDTTFETVKKFFLTAGAIGLLYKKNASISGAEMGCQGEVGVASSMAAGALTAILGGNVQQVEKAAEIAIEHHLGMTCDPVAGLVQIPCIERNGMGSVKAVNAARLALFEEDVSHVVPLDKAIQTMRDTGRDMCTKYKETSQGGLAVNVPEC